jgi:acetylornithine deacetylase
MSESSTRPSRLPATDLDAAVERLTERAFGFLERLVAQPSTVGNEAGAQDVVAAELERLGFTVERIPVPDDIATLPGSGLPLQSYEGREIVAGRLARARGPSLLINGHVDVVPAADVELWSTQPFEPCRADGWMTGRGAGDMKSGFAMATLAVEAALECEPALRAAPISFVSVIEEECTGNGALAAARAGYLADAVFLPETTGLELLLDGITVIWAEIEVRGRAVHAARAGKGVNPVEAALPLIAALRRLEAEINEGQAVRHATNFGTFAAGDWRSSVPAVARLGVRVGFPREVAPADAQDRVREAIANAARQNSWLAESPPVVRFEGFRAEGYTLPRDHELVAAISRAHQGVFGEPPAIAEGTATTDARFYLNQFGVPALCYGPRARNIHGVDEAVELKTIVDGARVVGRFLLERYGYAT